MGILDAFDPVSEVSANFLKISKSDLTDAYAPELLVMLEEIPAGFFLTDMGRIILGIISGLVGTVATGYVSMPERDKQALLHMSAHWLTHPNAPGFFGLGQASQVDASALAVDLQALKQGIATGNLDALRQSVMNTPQEIENYFKGVYSQFQALFAPGGAVSAPTPSDVVSQIASAVGYGEVF